MTTNILKLIMRIDGLAIKTDPFTMDKCLQVIMLNYIFVKFLDEKNYSGF